MKRKLNEGKIIIISSPSGGGKTSICRRLLSPSRKKKGWRFSISYTTRDRRPGERNGREYFFVSDRKFMEMTRKGSFAESFRVHLYRYGTPSAPLDKVVKSGGVMLLDIDVQGARMLQKKFPNAITIFILPPSVKALRQRLRQRGTETKEQLRVRFENSREEMKLYKKFDYVVINRELKAATEEVVAIINSAHCRTDKINAEQIATLIS